MRRVDEARSSIVVRQLRENRVERFRGVAQSSRRGEDDLARRSVVEVPHGVAHDKAAPRAKLPDDDAESIEVDATIAGLLPRDFRSDVSGLGEDDAGHGVASAVLSSSCAKIDEFDLAAVADHHILRRHIAMHDAQRRAVRRRAPVHVSQRLGNLEADRDHHGPIDLDASLGRALTHLAERSTLDVLEHGKWFPVLVGRRLENLGNPRMVELSLDAGLIQKSRQK